MAYYVSIAHNHIGTELQNLLFDVNFIYNKIILKPET